MAEKKKENNSKFVTRTIRITAEDLEYLTAMFEREYSLDFTAGLRVLLRKVVRKDQRIEEAKETGTLQTTFSVDDV